MPETRPHSAARPRVPQADLDTLHAMASLARRTGCVVHVVVAREPGVVEHARAAAHAAGLDVSVDLRPFSVRIRFDGAAT